VVTLLLEVELAAVEALVSVLLVEEDEDELEPVRAERSCRKVCIAAASVESLLLVELVELVLLVELLESGSPPGGGPPGGGPPAGPNDCIPEANWLSVRLLAPLLSIWPHRLVAWSVDMPCGRPATNSASVTDPSPLASSCENSCEAFGGPPWLSDEPPLVEVLELPLSLCACSSVVCRLAASCWKAVVRSLSVMLAIDVLEELLVELVVLAVLKLVVLVAEALFVLPIYWLSNWLSASAVPIELTMMSLLC
jgi:hypothetical protein